LGGGFDGTIFLKDNARNNMAGAIQILASAIIFGNDYASLCMIIKNL
jgi:hypothetical protein